MLWRSEFRREIWLILSTSLIKVIPINSAPIIWTILYWLSCLACVVLQFVTISMILCLSKISLCSAQCLQHCVGDTMIHRGGNDMYNPFITYIISRTLNTPPPINKNTCFFFSYMCYVLTETHPKWIYFFSLTLHMFSFKCIKGLQEGVNYTTSQSRDSTSTLWDYVIQYSSSVYKTENVFFELVGNSVRDENCL